MRFAGRRTQFRKDGFLPTLATKSSLHVVGLGREMTLAEIAFMQLGSIQAGKT